MPLRREAREQHVLRRQHDRGQYHRKHGSDDQGNTEGRRNDRQGDGLEPQAAVDGKWTECTPETVGGFSGTAYFFARALHEKLKVPVGIVHSSWGGTAIEAWTSWEAQQDDPRLHAGGLAYSSDVNAIGAIARSYPGKLPAEGEWDGAFMSASLDHAMWFHRPARADAWVLLDMVGHGMIGTRGLATGQVFTESGRHVVTIAQEGLLRRRRPR